MINLVKKTHHKIKYYRKLSFQCNSKNEFIIHDNQIYRERRTNQKKYNGLPATFFDDILLFPKQNQNSNQRKN